MVGVISYEAIFYSFIVGTQYNHNHHIKLLPCVVMGLVHAENMILAEVVAHTYQPYC